MNRQIWLTAIGAACITLLAPALLAQAQNKQPQQSQPAQNQSVPQSQQPASQPNGNPFPEDLSAVPVIPSGNTSEAIDDAGMGSSADAAPPVDSDPVKSPEEMAPGGDANAGEFSSSQSGLDHIVAPPDSEPAGKYKNDGSAADSAPHETAGKNIEVGNFYLDRKNWNGALSRFQSAMVLAPENPDVYWGLAECERHLGQFAEARANYLKVVEYDPDSKHGKEAQKALKDPQLANAASQPAARK